MGNKPGVKHRKPSDALLDEVIATFKNARTSRDISIPKLAETCPLADAAIRLFETGKSLNPTLATLEAYAAGLGLFVVVSLVPPRLTVEDALGQQGDIMAFCSGEAA